MSFNGYNLKNQRLSSEQMRTLLAFCSDNYAGAITEDTQEDVITVNGSKITISNDYDFLVDGFLVHGGNGEEIDFTNDNSGLGALGAIIISTSIPSDEDNTITTDQISATVGLTGLTAVITVVDEVETIDIKAGENTIVEDYHCQTFEYNGNYIIPLACTTNNGIRILLPCMSKSHLEEFLTESAYEQLKTWAEGKFVWRIGGEEVGNIGNLNVTNDLISNPEGTSIKIGDSNDVVEINGIQLDFSGVGALYKENDDSGIVINTLPVTQGGTGGTNIISSKMV